MTYLRADMTCGECGQNFILVGEQVCRPESPTCRRVLREHADAKHDGTIPPVTIRCGNETFQWSIND